MKKRTPISFLVSLLTGLAAVILTIFQFSGLLRLRTNELLTLIILLLGIMSSVLFGGWMGSLHSIQVKLKGLEALINKGKITAKTEDEDR
jgi:hypothetical protein